MMFATIHDHEPELCHMLKKNEVFLKEHFLKLSDKNRIPDLILSLTTLCASGKIYKFPWCVSSSVKQGH